MRNSQMPNALKGLIGKRNAVIWEKLGHSRVSFVFLCECVCIWLATVDKNEKIPWFRWRKNSAGFPVPNRFVWRQFDRMYPSVCSTMCGTICSVYTHSILFVRVDSYSVYSPLLIRSIQNLQTANYMWVCAAAAVGAVLLLLCNNSHASNNNNNAKKSKRLIMKFTRERQQTNHSKGRESYRSLWHQRFFFSIRESALHLFIRTVINTIKYTHSEIMSTVDVFVVVDNCVTVKKSIQL